MTLLDEHHISSSAWPEALLAQGYPRPQLVRPAWSDLSGRWDFAHDDDDSGMRDGWYLPGSAAFDRTITVPYPPESPASGIGDTGYHPVVWYRRVLTGEVLDAAGVRTPTDRYLLHFGAVDYRADIWLDGQYLGRHEGGSTPFTFDITDLVDHAGQSALVVRAADDPLDLAQPRGKQDWLSEPHGIWYDRTTGIWQPVWLELVPATRVESLAWIPDVTNGSVQLRLELSSRPTAPVLMRVSLSYEGTLLAELQFRQAEPRSSTVITLAGQINGQAYEKLLWSPEHPRLIDAIVHLEAADGSTDEVASYLGLRSAGIAGGYFMLNDRPYYLRAVLEQGYWPGTHLAAPDGEALRNQVQLAKDLGFNTVRMHEKVEDPRYLYWADRLGLLVWGENASAYEFSVTAVERMTREWMDIVRRDMSHPCIVTWVPLNESWGVQHISHQRDQLDYARALYHLVKALDPTRPVVSNDGWEHAESDIWTIHDYSLSGAEMKASYADRRTVEEIMSGIGPLGRRMRLVDTPDRGQPTLVSEFGGISYAPANRQVAWGYLTAQSAAEFERLLTDQFEALQSSPVLAGFCYTQLTDVLQEANGLTDPQRRPKLPVETIRNIVLGRAVDISSHRRPKKAAELTFAPDTAEVIRAAAHNKSETTH
jgi:beta-galactosidase/beta-glucuronidase